MMVPTKTRAGWTAAAACLLAGSLAAGADGAPHELAAAAKPASLRVMVKLVHASEDANAISAEAARIAGVPVTYATATSPAWHAISLHCASVAECDRAFARLRGASATYQAVEIDARKSRSAS
jgi:hypothetical protein